MLRKLSRLFTIKNRFDACAIIYALAVGAVMRGIVYLETYPGMPGKLLFCACLGAVFMAGGKLLDATRAPRRRGTSLQRVVARARALG